MVVKWQPWPKPVVGWVAITVDGSFLQFNGSAGIGCIVRDRTGAVLMTACKVLPAFLFKGCLFKTSFFHNQTEIRRRSLISLLIGAH
jgi:hypothetical protein